MRDTRPGKTDKKLWNIPTFHRQINYLTMAVFNSYVKLPEGIQYVDM